MTETFEGSFTQQEPIEPEGIEAAIRVMQHGRIHRYNLADGEDGETALLEREFAEWLGVQYCLAVASGGYAMATALRAVGVRPGMKVLSNAFTLAPVPGSIASVGAEPVFVGVTEALTIDLEDLAAKASSSGARVLLLSHMRGHICDMDRLMKICNGAGITVIEDCAHTMGAEWNGTPSGRHGAVACYSTQTYKHMNSGEGGLLTTDDPHIAARATLLSGSYMLYDRNGASPSADVFEAHKYQTPNISGRMDNLRAAILRPQIGKLAARRAAWRDRYTVLEQGLAGTPGLTLIPRPKQEDFVGSSIQVLLLDWTNTAIEDVVAACKARGVELKWFGAPEPAAFTSTYDHWQYAPTARMPASDRVLRGILDMRLPLTFSLEDCNLISRIIREEVSAAASHAKAAE